jgi:Xaa-Pro aminopeptidase
MYSARIQAIQKEVQEQNSDAFFITNFYNILYLTGFQTLSPGEREAYVLLTKDKTYFFTDSRYVDDNLYKMLRGISAEFKLIEVGKGLLHHLQEIVKSENIQTIGFEEEDITYLEYTKLKSELSDVELKSFKGVIAKYREIKDTTEIQTIRKACELTDQCLKELIPIMKVGMSEQEFAWKLEVWVREKGHELAFAPIVAVDTNAAVPHYDTLHGQGTIQQNSIVMIDFGVKYNAYNSDITRMVFFGEQPSQVVNTYTTLLQAQVKGLEVIQKDAYLNEVDVACRTELEKNNLPTYKHSTGHGIGLEVHEGPRVSITKDQKVKENQVFTVEPGVYLLGKYGMRIEDTVWVDSEGKGVALTQFSKELLYIK